MSLLFIIFIVWLCLKAMSTRPGPPPPKQPDPALADALAEYLAEMLQR